MLYARKCWLPSIFANGLCWLLFNIFQSFRSDNPVCSCFSGIVVLLLHAIKPGPARLVGSLRARTLSTLLQDNAHELIVCERRLVLRLSLYVHRAIRNFVYSRAAHIRSVYHSCFATTRQWTEAEWSLKRCESKGPLEIRAGKLWEFKVRARCSHFAKSSKANDPQMQTRDGSTWLEILCGFELWNEKFFGPRPLQLAKERNKTQAILFWGRHDNHSESLPYPFLVPSF